MGIIDTDKSLKRNYEKRMIGSSLFPLEIFFIDLILLSKLLQRTLGALTFDLILMTK
jgi:hypothetical protein